MKLLSPSTSLPLLRLGFSLTIPSTQTSDALHEDDSHQPLSEGEVDEEDCMGMKATPAGQAHLHHLRVVRDEDFHWLPWCSGHQEAVEGLMHADQVPEREGPLTCSDPPMEGEGLGAPRNHSR